MYGDDYFAALGLREIGEAGLGPLAQAITLRAIGALTRRPPRATAHLLIRTNLP